MSFIIAQSHFNVQTIRSSMNHRQSGRNAVSLQFEIKCSLSSRTVNVRMVEPVSVDDQQDSVIGFEEFVYKC